MSRIFFLMIIASSIFAQQDPFFMPFEGDAYKIPAKHVMNAKFGYTDDVLEYEKIAKISWQEIKIPNRETTTPFPDVDRLDQLAMVLHSEMIIKQNGCYAFVLESDDGSRFWIGEREIINNDGTHKMTRKYDTLQLIKGKYPIKLWYYQGFKNRYGFIFDGKYLDQECAQSYTKLTPETIGSQRALKIENNLLFDYNSASIKEEAISSLDSLATSINSEQISSITIRGFTCNQGMEEYNSALSQKRADAIRDILIEKINKPGITYRSIGMGEQEPIASNETKEGKSKNRRVEILVE